MGPALKRRAFRSKPGRGRRYLLLIAISVWIFSFGIYVLKRKIESHGTTLVPKKLGERSDSKYVKSIALLFLTKGHLPLHQIWELWLASCAGMVPVVSGSNSCAYGNAEVKSRRTDTSVVDQRLFNIYVHAPPDFPGRLPSWGKQMHVAIMHIWSIQGFYVYIDYLMARCFRACSKWPFFHLILQVSLMAPMNQYGSRACSLHHKELKPLGAPTHC